MLNGYHMYQQKRNTFAFNFCLTAQPPNILYSIMHISNSFTLTYLLLISVNVTNIIINLGLSLLVNLCGFNFVVKLRVISNVS